ncbi:hypothetical protein M8C21_027831, partial [Ambrosia artemisiifolia]
MNATFHKLSNQTYNHIRTRCSIPNTIHRRRTHVQRNLHLPNPFCPRFFLPIRRRFCSKTNGTTPSASFTNSGPIWWYLSMIKARPILTKSLTSAIIYTAADLTSQTITKSSSEAYDFIRTCRMAGFGMTIFGPIMTALFFSVNAGLQGERVQEIMARLKRDMLPTMISNAIYWPLCDFLTFRFIPVHL